MLTGVLATGLLFVGTMAKKSEYSIEPKVLWEIGYVVSIAYTFIVTTILASVVGHVSMIFKITRYWSWVVHDKLEGKELAAEQTFLWDRARHRNWEAGTTWSAATEAPLFGLLILGFSASLVCGISEGEICKNPIYIAMICAQVIFTLVVCYNYFTIDKTPYEPVDLASEG